jgi:hypothetical protein
LSRLEKEVDAGAGDLHWPKFEQAPWLEPGELFVKERDKVFAVGHGYECESSQCN